MSAEKKRDYRFVLPQVKKEIIGTQGEVAEYIPYRTNDHLTAKDILKELKRQPHMAALADYIQEDRKIYLIEGSNKELLQLAAEYVGTYHCLASGDGGFVECDSDSEDDDWADGDANYREFDFEANMPYLSESNVMEVYCPEEETGFGGRFYRGDQNIQKRPWWTRSASSPVVIETWGNLSNLPELVRAMDERERIIILHLIRPMRFRSFEACDMWEGGMNMTDLSFELETEMIVLEEAETDSVYKKQILRQIAREKGEGLAASVNAGKILSLVKESRGDADNQTIAKAVSNALMRKKTKGQLVAKDFEYLGTLQAKKRTKNDDREDMELVGQADVRRQMERIVKNMVFQKRRKEMGLPSDEIHYTFAFLGAPGTGKTTWAMRLAKEMEKRGLLDNTESICINAAELKAKYVGHTTGKVKALFEQYGVIILDEAYSLTEGENGDSFGAEALAQLCVELEKHGNDRLVIFAGYGGSNNSEDNRMLRFLQSNPGINSRVSFKIHFQNFKAEELVKVFHTMMSYNGYAVPSTADGVVADFFRSRMKERAFGNCREVRNLADRVKIQIASRLAEKTNCTKEEIGQVVEEDVRAAVQEILEEYQGLAKNHVRSIGFR